MNEISKDYERLKILERISEYEKGGMFDKDLEQDPPFEHLQPHQVDFLNRKIKNKIKRVIANYAGRRFYKKMLKEKQVIFSGVKGLENLEGFTGGAIVTCNHFHMFDNYAVLMGLKKHFKRLTLYKMIREGNYALPGKFGFFMRHCDTLPLSQNLGTMAKCLKAIQTLIKRKKLVLIYPEQGMWWNYRKPRPLKIGAYKIAAKFDAPVIPCFITLSDSDLIGADGFNVQEFTLNILPVIYPDKNLGQKENGENMKNENFRLWKDLYEKTYGKSLSYGNDPGNSGAAVPASEEIC